MLIACHSERSQSVLMSGFFVSGFGAPGEVVDVRSGEGGGGGDRIGFCLRLRLRADRRADPKRSPPKAAATAAPMMKMTMMINMYQKAATIAQPGVTGLPQWTMSRSIVWMPKERDECNPTINFLAETVDIAWGAPCD
jgi:hypothetical protein